MNWNQKIWFFTLVLTLVACGDDAMTTGDSGIIAPPTGDAGADADAEPMGENMPPVAVDDTAMAYTERPVQIRLIENDSDPNTSDALIISEIVQPTNGFVEILAGEREVRYTSNADFTGNDSFEYTVSDQRGGTDQATVTVRVEEVPILTLEITSPEAGATVTGPGVSITFVATGCPITSPSMNPEGCHVHKFLDGEQYTNADGMGHGHYNPSPFTITPITAGEHTFRLVLISNAGMDAPVDPPVSASVTFTVE